MPKQNDPYEALRLTDEQLAALTGDEYEDFPPDEGDLYYDDWWDDSYDCGCCMCCGCSCDDDDFDDSDFDDSDTHAGE